MLCDGRKKGRPRLAAANLHRANGDDSRIMSVTQLISLARIRTTSSMVILPVSRPSSTTGNRRPLPLL
jgi:hypothetical protein